MRITGMATRSLPAILALTVVHAATAQAGVRVVDGHYRLVTVVKDTAFGGANGATIGGDGALYVVHTGDGSTTRIDLKTLAATEFVHPWSVGSGPAAVEFAWPLHVTADGDIYLGTSGRGVIALKRSK
jgi:hypothetical protein